MDFTSSLVICFCFDSLQSVMIRYMSNDDAKAAEVKNRRRDLENTMA